MSNSVSGTMRAADFTGSLGINTHIDFGTSHANLPTVKASINYLDAKNIRGSMENPVNTTTWLAVTQATGAKRDEYVAETSVSNMSIRLAYAPAVTAEGILNVIEGANEDDTVPQGPRNTPAVTVLFQQQVYAMGQFLSLLSINMSLGFGWTAANNWHGDYDKVGDLSAYTSMLVSDPLTGTGTIQTGSDTSTSVSVPDHSILIKTIDPATPAISPPVVVLPVVMSPAAPLPTPLTTLPDTATSVATAHVTVDYWNQAGQESTKTLNVTVSAPASAVAAVAAVSSNNAAITSVTTTATMTMSFLSSATLATAVAGSKVTVMPKAGAAAVTLTPNFTAGAVLDFRPTMAQTSWDGKLGDRGG